MEVYRLLPFVCNIYTAISQSYPLLFSIQESHTGFDPNLGWGQFRCSAQVALAGVTKWFMMDLGSSAMIACDNFETRLNLTRAQPPQKSCSFFGDGGHGSAGNLYKGVMRLAGSPPVEVPVFNTLFQKGEDVSGNWCGDTPGPQSVGAETMQGILGLAFPDAVAIQEGNYENLTEMPGGCHDDVSIPATTAFSKFLQQQGQNRFAMRWLGTLGQGQQGNELLLGDSVDEFLFGKDVITTKIVPIPTLLETPNRWITYNIQLSGIQVVAGAETFKQIPIPVDTFHAIFDSGATQISLPRSICDAMRHNSDKSGLELRFLLGRDGSQMLKLPLTPELVGTIPMKPEDLTFETTAWGPFQCIDLKGEMNMGLHLMRWYDMTYDLEKKEMSFVPKTPILRLKFGTEESKSFWIWIAIGFAVCVVAVVVTCCVMQKQREKERRREGCCKRCCRKCCDSCCHKKNRDYSESEDGSTETEEESSEAHE